MTTERPTRQKDKTAKPATVDAIDLRRLDGFLSYHLRRTRTLLSRRYAELVANSAPLGTLTALAAITDNPGLSQATLGRELGLNKSTAVLLIDALSEKKWAERRPAPHDRRVHALYPTPEGEKQLQRMLSDLDMMEQQVLSPVSEQDQKRLIDLLRHIGDVLSDPPPG